MSTPQLVQDHISHAQMTINGHLRIESKVRAANLIPMPL